ncbi:MAG: N-acetylmuramoyl-L-alanine amidase [Myxococcota bacterium]|nr:N-acetylmuramoyl-L-alanine amidase [Myxococcota bacterium]
MGRVALTLGATLAGLSLVSLQSVAESGRTGFDTVVIDAGHGGEDHGARSGRGLAEKEIVLDISRRLATRLRARGLSVKLTRSDDRFVPLETRTSLANRAAGDLFISVHANSAVSARPRGAETYYVSLDASDPGAGRLALRENDSFGEGSLVSARADPLAALLGDLVVTEHVHESSEFAKLVQGELAGLGGGDRRGVKQAPFVVLMGVEMPAALIEIGFLSNPEEERELRRSRRRDAIADSIARAVESFGKRYDARRGVEKGIFGLGAAR